MSARRVRPPIVLTAVAAFLARRPRFALWLAEQETRALDDLLPPVPAAPIWVAGLARAGSTLLIEALARHPDVATHRHRDFPLVAAPWWWSLAVRATPRLPARPKERAHGDGVLVTPESPDAYEEMLWGLEGVAGDAFPRVHGDHLRKILHIRRRSRYAAKANEHAGRLARLRAMHPGARFVVPVREPADHVASLVRQHERFVEAGRQNPRIPRHMALAGHREFGPLRVPPRGATPEEAAEIAAAWASGDEVLGWALAWRASYRAVRDAGVPVHVVRFDELRASPERVLAGVFAFCDLPIDESTLRREAAAIRAPSSSPLPPRDAERVRAVALDVSRDLDVTAGAATRA